MNFQRNFGRPILCNILLLLVFCCVSTGLGAQDVMFQMGVASFRAEKDKVFADAEKSPLTDTDRRAFDGLPYFEADINYRVKARFERVNGKVIEMATTTDRLAKYRPYGQLSFQLDGKQLKLTVYEQVVMPGKPDKSTSLFLPFTDLTNAEETYGGGRYIDIEKQEGEEWVLDFNLSYNPYCAYNAKYSCPIPPKENHLEVRIPAGVRYKSKD